LNTNKKAGECIKALPYKLKKTRAKNIDKAKKEEYYLCIFMQGK